MYVKRKGARAATQRGANSPLPHCGWNGRRRCGETRWQRGANSPLPHCGRQAAARAGAPLPNEGRIRPSLIAARIACAVHRGPAPNEGRIRPSLIAALPPPVPRPRQENQRGANSPLPHCGTTIQTTQTQDTAPNEGRIRPSLIAASVSQRIDYMINRQRGANSPLPHCGRMVAVVLLGGSPSTRGEFAPPSLRLRSPPWVLHAESSNEGRIRPSLIAAGLAEVRAGRRSSQRGANSPLPHCGPLLVSQTAPRSSPTRGEFAPPSLRQPVRTGFRQMLPPNEGRIRPSLIAAVLCWKFLLREGDNEGRIRPSLIAANNAATSSG